MKRCLLHSIEGGGEGGWAAPRSPPVSLTARNVRSASRPQKAADQARRNPANERALLDIEIRRMRLRADVTAAENQSGISADDIAIDARDLRFRPEDNTDEEADEDAISGRR